MSRVSSSSVAARLITRPTALFERFGNLSPFLRKRVGQSDLIERATLETFVFRRLGCRRRFTTRENCGVVLGV